jgi:hypothetical protein
MRLLPLAAVLAACAACTFLGFEEQSFEGGPADSSDRVPVVDDVGAFDPSEAVDDDDGPVPLADTDDPTDRDPFDDTAESSGQGVENERGDAEPGTKREPVADPAEVEQREEEKSRAVERIDASAADEDELKTELGRNPPPERALRSEGPGTKALDLALEALIVAGAAALISAGVVFARSHAKLATATALGLALLSWFFWTQRG